MPSFVGLCLLIKLIKHTKETSWNGPLAYQWIENIVCETFISYSSVCCLHGAGFPLVLILFFRWRVVGLQCCVSFRYIAEWMSYTYILEKEMATQSSVLAWRIPGTGEPGGLLSMGSHRVGHDWTNSLSLFTFMHWRRKWQPSPVFLPGESQGWGSLVGCRLWGRTESDMTEAT